MTSTPHRVLVVGTGSIARRHLENVRALQPSVPLAVASAVDGRRVPSEMRRLADSAFESWDAALRWAPTVAIVANPAPFHLETAELLADHRVHLLVEKPFSTSSAGVEELILKCRNRALVLLVGYCLRFSRSLQALREVVASGEIGRPHGLRVEVGQFLPEWRPGTDYRRGVTARRALGGGALFELSHELDAALWVLGPAEVAGATLDRVGALDIDAEDSADVILRFENGAIGTVHMDLLQQPSCRAYKVWGDAGATTWDGITGEVRLYSVHRGAWETTMTADPVGNSLLIRELSHLFACIDGCAQPEVTGEDGLAVVRLIEAVRASTNGLLADEVTAGAPRASEIGHG